MWYAASLPAESARALVVDASGKQPVCQCLREHVCKGVAVEVANERFLRLVVYRSRRFWERWFCSKPSGHNLPDHVRNARQPNGQLLGASDRLERAAERMPTAGRALRERTASNQIASPAQGLGCKLRNFHGIAVHISPELDVVSKDEVW